MTKSLNSFNKFNGIGFLLAIPVLLGCPPALALEREISFAQSEITIQTDSGNQRFTVELAITPEQQKRGLMFRRTLPAKAGMLFIYTPPQNVSMWMKDTFISLDMLFIDDTNKIIYIARRTTPQSEYPITANQQVASVLELNAGTAEKYAIQIGDVVEYEHE